MNSSLKGSCFCDPGTRRTPTRLSFFANTLVQSETMIIYLSCISGKLEISPEDLIPFFFFNCQFCPPSFVQNLSAWQWSEAVIIRPTRFLVSERYNWLHSPLSRFFNLCTTPAPPFTWRRATNRRIKVENEKGKFCRIIKRNCEVIDDSCTISTKSLPSFGSCSCTPIRPCGCYNATLSKQTTKAEIKKAHWILKRTMSADK